MMRKNKSNWTLPQGSGPSLVATRSYETHRNLIVQYKNVSGTGTVSQFDYQNNALGQRTRMTMGGSALPDELDGSYWAFTNTAADVWAELNAVGVLLGGATNGEDIVAVDTGHVFVARTPETFTYDADGNLTQDARFRYEWDAENRMTLVETRTNLQSATPRVRLTFVYDHQGRRIQKTVESGYSGGTYSATDVTAYIWDGWNMIREIKTPNNPSPITNNFVWGLDLSGSVQGAGGIGGLLYRVDSSGSALTYTYDANGNVGQLIDATNGIAAHYEYDPFGNTIVQAGPAAAENPFRFSTKYADHETGLVYYGYRYYNPELGRWLNRDPLGEWGGWNLYLFAENSPLNLLDALGLNVIGKDKIVALDKTYPRTQTETYQTSSGESACWEVDI